MQWAINGPSGWQKWSGGGLTRGGAEQGRPGAPAASGPYDAADARVLVPRVLSCCDTMFWCLQSRVSPRVLRCRRAGAQGAAGHQPQRRPEGRARASAGGLPPAGRRLVEHVRQEDPAAADGGDQRQPVPRAPGGAGHHARALRRLLRDQRALGARRTAGSCARPGRAPLAAGAAALPHMLMLLTQSTHHKLLSCMSSCPSCMSDRVRYNPALEAKWAHLNAQDSSPGCGWRQGTQRLLWHRRCARTWGGRRLEADVAAALLNTGAPARRCAWRAAWRSTSAWASRTAAGRAATPAPAWTPSAATSASAPRVRISRQRGCSLAPARAAPRAGACDALNRAWRVCGRPVPAPSRRALRRAPCQPGHGWDHARPLHAP